MEREPVGAAVTVRSSAVDLGDVLPERVQAAVARVTSKYFDNLTAATVYFSREGLDFRCTVNVQVGSMPILTGEARHLDPYQSFDIALEKVAKQLRRRKRALREDKPSGVRAAAVLAPA